MSDPRNRLDREEEAIQESYDQGEITLEEYNQEIRELQRDYREDAREAARGAYERELENW